MMMVFANQVRADQNFERVLTSDPVQNSHDSFACDATMRLLSNPVGLKSPPRAPRLHPLRVRISFGTRFYLVE